MSAGITGHTDDETVPLNVSLGQADAAIHLFDYPRAVLRGGTYRIRSELGPAGRTEAPIT